LRLADADVRRDTGSTAAALGLLGILLLVAVVLALMSGFATGQSFWTTSKATSALMPLALMLMIVLALVVPGPVVLRVFRKHTLGAGRVVLGCLLYVGVLITTIVGLGVVFFLACLAGLADR
jgi:hypothetical protein